MPGTTNIGNNCDDCGDRNLPCRSLSPLRPDFHDCNGGSNGRLAFGTAYFAFGVTCMPETSATTMAILPYQDDLRTESQFYRMHVFPGATCGVFTSVTGTAPNRKFNIEWRAVHFAGHHSPARLRGESFHENISTSFDVIYGATTDSGLDGTRNGVQASPTGTNHDLLRAAGRSYQWLESLHTVQCGISDSHAYRHAHLQSGVAK